MALVNPYCSVADVQRETGNSDADLVSQFEDAINVASRWVEDYCHCDFLPHSYTGSAYTLSLKDAIGDTLYLPWPIITLTEVKAATVVVAADQYIYDVGSRAIRLRDGSYWIAPPQGARGANNSYSLQWAVASTGLTEPITVKGTFGYTSPPSGVRLACQRLAAAFTHEKRRERVSFDGSRTSILDTGIPDDVATLLKKFKRLVY